MTASTRAVASPRSPLTRPVPVRLPPGWPLIALLALYPLWWALGLGIAIFPILAIPMAVALLRRRRVLVPPGFALWLLFLGVVLISLVALEYDPPGTVPESALDRLPGALLRLVEYLSLTVLLLYAGNLSERELPRRRLIGLLAWSFLITVAGGVVGALWPQLSFTAPVEALLPDRYANNGFIQTLVHPSVAQMHQVLGYPTPRPAAPWGYTNLWGNNFLLLLPWFVVFCWRYTTRRWHRVAGCVVLAVSVVPVVVSLNRGLWLGLGVAAGYVTLRLALRGQLLPVTMLATISATVVLLVVVTPLGELVAERLAYGHSNDIRLYTTEQAVRGLSHSPLIGFGSTRETLGSSSSIAIGPSPDCPNCGHHTIGSNGQVWLELHAHGLLGAGLFLGFFGYLFWRHRGDHSPVGLAGSTVLLVNLLASAYYNTLLTPLAFTFLGYAVAWKATTAPSAAAPPGPAPSAAAIRQAPLGAAPHAVGVPRAPLGAVSQAAAGGSPIPGARPGGRAEREGRLR